MPPTANAWADRGVSRFGLGQMQQANHLETKEGIVAYLEAALEDGVQP